MARKAKRTATSGREDGVNRSEKVREYLKANPGAMPKEVADKLTAEGIPVTAQLVSTIKFNLTHKGQPKRGRAAAARGGRKGKVVSATVSIETLRAAKSLADHAGSIRDAHAVLDALESLR